MATDRARNSYDASRHYRSVVAQQGRVTVEADVNEAELIRTDESRAELVDIIGPTGTPDLGYQISIPTSGAAFGFSIHAGTIYVGGLRVHLDANETYETQKTTEWVDAPVPDPDVPKGQGSEIVYLELVEQEVSAVEDSALREVALGGPDTSGRTRLIQHVRRAPATTTDCTQALVKALDNHAHGLAFDRRTMELRSAARLTVDFVPVPDDASLCQPIAKAGFLGAENQLIRVQVARDGTLVWGYDNASFSYRVKAATTTTVTTLELDNHPVDEFHRPRPHQWIEVLRSTVVLDGDAYVAAAIGELHEVASYDATTNTITLATKVDDTSGPKLFARVWEGRFTTASSATELVDANGTHTGVRITQSGELVSGDYWMIGVRPTQPDKLYPARLLSPQPPDGPRRWAAPLATIAWAKEGKTGFVHDCRRFFKPLTEDGDLAFHNKHLHGWGVVCGLQVRCMTEDIARRKKLEQPREWVNVFQGYAIDPNGHDIRIYGSGADKYVPLALGELAVIDGVLTRDPAGKLSDGTVSLWIDEHRGFHTEKFEQKDDGWKQLLDGTLLLDIYNDCILNVIKYVQGEITPGAGDGLVGPAQKRLISLLNLLIQLVNQTSGRYVYISAAEDAVLRELYDGLKKLLESKSFCALFDGADYPAYDVYRADVPTTAPRPTTLFGVGFHNRLRINSHRGLACTCGVGSKINTYDLKTNHILAATDFPVAGAVVQDVAFSSKGDTIYAVAWVGSAQVDSLFISGTFKTDGSIQWSTNQVNCALKIVTLATDDRSLNRVYAAARGQGVYVFDTNTLTSPPELLRKFYASGQLVAMHDGRGTYLYAGENMTLTNAVTFDQIHGIAIGDTPPKIYELVSPLGGQRPLGEDIAVAYSANNKVDELYAICATGPTTRELLIWDRPQDGLFKRSVLLGTSAQSRIAYNAAGNWSLITYEDSYRGLAFQPKQEKLESGFHPLQVGPISVASDDGNTFYVLEWMSNTITAIPALPTQQAPWQSTIDIAKLERYRLAAIASFIKLLGRFVQYLKDCVCDHLLVNCPDGRGKKVYLADVAFRNGEVYQICNFHHRRYVHTFPTIEYWMSFVPVIPLIKHGVEKLCCSVFRDVFDKYTPPRTSEKDRGDLISSVVVRNGAAAVKQFNLSAQYQARKIQLVEGLALGRMSLNQKLAQPPAGKNSPPVNSLSLVGGNVETAIRLAATKNVTVRRTVVAANPLDTVLKVGLAEPTLEANDTVDLITDSSGRVIGVTKASGDTAMASTPAPSADELTALRKDLTAMRDLHQQNVATITELQSRMKQLEESLHRLTPEPVKQPKPPEK